jgi:hypothetical protein
MMQLRPTHSLLCPHLTSLPVSTPGSHYCKAPTRARIPPAHRIAHPSMCPAYGTAPSQYTPHAKDQSIKSRSVLISSFLLPLFTNLLPPPSRLHQAHMRFPSTLPGPWPIPMCTCARPCHTHMRSLLRTLTNSHPFPTGLHLTSLPLFKAGFHYLKAPTRVRLPPAHRIPPSLEAPHLGCCPTPVQGLAPSKAQDATDPTCCPSRMQLSYPMCSTFKTLLHPKACLHRTALHPQRYSRRIAPIPLPLYPKWLPPPTGSLMCT